MAELKSQEAKLDAVTALLSPVPEQIQQGLEVIRSVSECVSQAREEIRSIAEDIGGLKAESNRKSSYPVNQLRLFFSFLESVV